MTISKKEHKIISEQEFEKKVYELRKVNSLVDRLINDLGSWESFPPHLLAQLFDLVGAKPRINKY